MSYRSRARRAFQSAAIAALVSLTLIGSAPAQAVATDHSFSAAQVPLIFPGMYMQGTEQAKYDVPAGTERLELRAPTGERIEALFCPALGETDAANCPTVLYFYGNAQCLATALSQVEQFREYGANVLIADYLGYGLSEGKPSEAGCYAAATALYEHAISRQDINPRKLVAAGWSLGAAVAIDLAHRKEVAGLITFSAYTSKRDLARRQFPDVPPSAIEHPFLSRDKIRTITCPTLIVHGRRDTLVPFTMSEELRRTAAGDPLTYLPIDRASHNDLFLVGGKEIEAAVRAFIERVDRRPAAASQAAPGR